MGIFRRREPAGAPTGGQFAVGTRSEPGVTLTPALAPADTVCEVMAEARGHNDPRQVLDVVQRGVLRYLREHVAAGRKRGAVSFEWDRPGGRGAPTPGSPVVHVTPEGGGRPYKVTLAGTPAQELLDTAARTQQYLTTTR